MIVEAVPSPLALVMASLKAGPAVGQCGNDVIGHWRAAKPMFE